MKQTIGPADESLRACSTAPRGVAMAIRFMQRNLARPLATGEIAAASGMSERSLRRQFQRFTGQSPIAFHRDLRLEAARHTLCANHTKADITTAAGMHGFSHLSHFTGQYRRRYGELPYPRHCARSTKVPCHCHRTPQGSQFVWSFFPSSARTRDPATRRS
jgi:transcriptional regulator GlxA family with amidase domain